MHMIYHIVKLKISVLLTVTSLISLSCQSQTKNQQLREVGGRCEGCEAVYEYGNKVLNNRDTITGFLEFSPKLKIYGTVYQNDGKTPAKDIIVYFYQTNQEGIYDDKGSTQNWLARHGVHRGWIKTDESGFYEIYTFRPASYPNTDAPQHIHMMVKEPTTIPYYIDDILFTDDPNFKPVMDKGENAKGGSGVLTLTKSNKVLEAQRNIILGKNVEGY